MQYHESYHDHISKVFQYYRLEDTEYLLHALQMIDFQSTVFSQRLTLFVLAVEGTSVI